jgi:hypothetical protein
MRKLPFHRRIVIMATGYVEPRDLENYGRIEGHAFEDDDLVRVATQEALGASLEIIGLHGAIWDDLISHLSTMGLFVEVEFETARRMEDATKRLEASLIIAKDAINLEVDWESNEHE